MKTVVIILCLTFLVVLVVYWMMPIKKMKAINNELIKLLGALPISRLAEGLFKYDEQKRKK